MIKLVLSDIDGTLIPHSEREISSEIKEQFLRLTEKGIAVCPASGRPYRSLKKLFEPIEDKLYYLCENGALVMGPGGNGKVLGKTAMPRGLCRDLCSCISADERLDICLSGENMSYLITKSERFVSQLYKFVGSSSAIIVNSPDEIEEDIIKISAHDWDGEEYYAGFKAKNAHIWEGRCDCAYAGGGWLDFTVANKGTGLDMLCAALGIDRSEVMSFGDNWNDVAMLEKSGCGYIMESSSDGLKEKFKLHCKNVADVLKTL